MMQERSRAEYVQRMRAGISGYLTALAIPVAFCIAASWRACNTPFMGITYLIVFGPVFVLVSVLGFWIGMVIPASRRKRLVTFAILCALSAVAAVLLFRPQPERSCFI